MFFFFFDEETNKESSKKSFDNIALTRTANKGEWSELYTLYKLLVEQNLFPINQEQNVGERLRMPILSILRYTEDDLAAEYRIGEDGQVRINANGTKVIEVDKNDFNIYATQLFKAIMDGNRSTFEIPSLDDFRKKTCCPKIKCFSKTLGNGEKDKSDLYIVIHDSFTGQTPKLGFSIKSEVGSAPTLLNATKLTNFEYKLSKNLPQETVEKINSMRTKTGKVDIRRRVKTIEEEGCSLDYFTISPNSNGESVFLENLILIDSSLPNIIAHLLKLSHVEDTKVLDALTDRLTNDNPLGFPMKSNKKYYEAKIKRFITDVALGMVPSQPWEATPQASGMLVVKDSGDIDCFHVIYKSALEEYLYHDLKFETASATRHDYGYIYTGEDGNQYFKLNLQLRFIR